MDAHPKSSERSRRCRRGVAAAPHCSSVISVNVFQLPQFQQVNKVLFWSHRRGSRGRRRPSWPHCVRWGFSSLQKGNSSPQFSAHVYCDQTARWIKVPYGMEVDQGPGHIVLDGDRQCVSPTKTIWHSSPHFAAHVYCGQTAGWIKMPLDTEV